ncbi:MAG: pirin family protein [Phycisphaeraceae bacterium]|nr:pirin family protein [Phycisphaeraceae bacterium]
MMKIRRASERGRTRFGWLDSWHSFSFGDYRDEDWMGYRSLRVINDDIVAAGGGFDTHPHRDMEIITIVLDGALEHKDSTGGGGVLRLGDVQAMSAGKGIFHSEFNHSKREPVRLIQTWIRPNERGLAPRYNQERFEFAPGEVTRVADGRGRDGAMTIAQDASVLVALPGAEGVAHKLAPGRGLWVQAAVGGISVNGQRLQEGDGAIVEEPGEVRIEGEGSIAVLFDLA